MKNKYRDLINQTFDFPQASFDTREGVLEYHGIKLMDLVEQYGTPLKFSYLPAISTNIQNCHRWFRNAMDRVGYRGKYYYCYCTKSSHFSHVLEQALKNDVYLEASSAYDLDIFRNLFESGKIQRDHHISCNGYKPEGYLNKLGDLLNEGFTGVVPIIDNFDELAKLKARVKGKLKIGIALADL